MFSTFPTTEDVIVALGGWHEGVRLSSKPLPQHPVCRCVPPGESNDCMRVLERHRRLLLPGHFWPFGRVRFAGEVDVCSQRRLFGASDGNAR